MEAFSHGPVGYPHIAFPLVPRWKAPFQPAGPGRGKYDQTCRQLRGTAGKVTVRIIRTLTISGGAQWQYDSGTPLPTSRRTPPKAPSTSTSGWATAGGSSSPTPRTSRRSARPSSGAFSKAKPEFDKRNAKLIGLSVDSVESHKGWAGDIEETQGSALAFPLIGDEDRKVADLYDMIHPNANDTLTVRSVFIIGPDKKVKLTLTYPASTGRNVDEIIRVLDSLQLTADYSVATPVNWTDGEDVIIVPARERRGRQGPLPQGLEGPQALPAGDAPAQPLRAPRRPPVDRGTCRPCGRHVRAAGAA